mgnify:CR=1 FL=1
MARAFLIVLDSVGIGGAPDAAAFGDTGSDTIGHIAEACAAGIGYGSTREGLTRCFESLTPEQVEASKQAMQECRARSEWSVIAVQTLELLERAASQELR